MRVSKIDFLFFYFIFFFFSDFRRLVSRDDLDVKPVSMYSYSSQRLGRVGLPVPILLIGRSRVRPFPSFSYYPFLTSSYAVLLANRLYRM